MAIDTAGCYPTFRNASADSIAAIPMLGSCDNAALAGALFLYEVFAQDRHGT